MAYIGCCDMEKARHRCPSTDRSLGVEWSTAMAARGVDARVARARDHLDVIRVAAAQESVVHANERESVRARLVDRDACRVMHGIEPDVVAAVQQCGDRGLVDGANRLARLARARMLGNRQDAREAERGIAAKLGIDEMIDDDARFVGAVADALHTALPERGGVFHLQQHVVILHSVHLPPWMSQ